ncbi:MCM3 minichromosome maintenance deficient 3 (S. cerevisiae), like [Coregonus clupeaformis]|uniref:MCM3 minichromosome maintenance deficient 3 (S. cerevisiae), like n=1 Tax=Coregonus clupeaformis TaxID=59861 RepID=UPI001BE016CF|nr:MCM3 minichromosome maintenance deficient 3 (S. cerevisiae), like [Coregonus clupeaformis]
MDSAGGFEDMELREAHREYLDFLDDDQDQGVYHERVRSMVSENRCRLIVNINDLRRRNEKRAKALLKDCFSELVAFQRALKDLVASIDATYAKQFEEFHVGFEGSFGTKHVTPRTLAARYLGNLVCVEGIVTKCSLVRPKITRSVHYCPATKKTLERKYTDLTSLDAFPSSAIYPTKDEENNPLETEFGLCAYKDHQTLTIQEMPEKAPAGQLPRSVDIIANDDLVDTVKPGDRVQMVGIYRCLPAKQGGFTSGTFRTILLANHVKRMSKEIVPTFSAEDINKIKKFSKGHSKDVFEHLSHSLAPSIHGHEYIKKAILCLLLGGNETNLENGTRIRGDINILLIGDPSTAKSQLLRYVLHTAPRAIPTTGRGSTGVGLTAAVTTDQETGERRLEAGAMVLADRGVVCIDEFDKMSDMDRTAIHEVMEQGRVTIAKAGIMARLNARCSVLAAANPVYGRYDQYKTPMENIGLQDSLLSRFDLLFIVLDQMDADSDRKVSEHVLRMHRYRAPGEQEGTAMPMGSTVDVFATEDPNITESAEQELQIYEKKDNILHGHRNKKEKVVTMEFIRKYIHVAKLVKPVLTQEASDHIAEEYSKLRSHDQVNSESARTMPVTARALETMIRLSTAHAKARMSKTTDFVDAEAALELMQFAYFKKILEKKRKVVEDDMDVSQSQSQSQSQEVASQRTSTRKRTGVGKENMDVTDAGAESDPYEFEDEEHTQSILKPKPAASQSLKKKPGQDISQDRLKLFKAALMKAFQTTRSQSVAVTELLTLVNKTTRGQDDHEFDEQEVEKLLGRMQDNNQVMMSEGVVFLI